MEVKCCKLTDWHILTIIKFDFRLVGEGDIMAYIERAITPSTANYKYVGEYYFHIFHILTPKLK